MGYLIFYSMVSWKRISFKRHFEYRMKQCRCQIVLKSNYTSLFLSSAFHKMLVFPGNNYEKVASVA